MTPEQRILRARLAALESWAATADPSARTARARANSPTSLAYWERQVDPDGILPEAERRRRAEAKHKAHMARMALASSRARAARKATPPDDGEAA